MSETKLDLHGFLTEILTPLVDQPEALRIEVKQEGRKLEALIHAADGDKGRIIGKSGRMISSLRTLARAAGEKHRLEVEVELHDEEGAPRPPRKPKGE